MTHPYTPVEKQNSIKTISTTSRIMTLGSCFSDNIGNNLADHKWRTVINPLGIVYNPVSLAKSIKLLSSGEPVNIADCKVNGEVHFHYDYHSQLSALSKEHLCSNINLATELGHNAIHSSDWLIITLGTSIGHELISEKSIVANNHRMPATNFTKRMLSISESMNSLSKSLLEHKDKNIILTVSPIRHTREGLIQNNRSKSRLIEVAHQLEEQNKNISYFPAYEIMIDEFRGYRYYEKDMIHPSKEAIDIIWQKFIHTYMDDTAKQKVIDVENYLRSARHKPQFPDSKSTAIFLDKLEKTKRELLVRYPEIG